MTLLLANLPDISGNSWYIKPLNPPPLVGFVKYEGVYIVWDNQGNKVLKTSDKVKVDWEIHNITGYLTIKGDWNICYYNSAYFLLDKVAYLGNEIHKYKLIRDFWVNDVLNNPSLKITGTLQKTSDKTLVSQNIYKTLPVTTGGNSMNYFSVSDTKTPDSEYIRPSKFINSPDTHFQCFYFQDINIHNNLQILWLPNPVLNWKGVFINKLDRFIKNHIKTLSVWDFNSTSQGGLLNKLNQKFPENKNIFYVLADKDSSSTTLANAKSGIKHITKVDLSNLSDIVRVSDSLEPKTEKNYKKINQLPQEANLFEKKNFILVDVDLEEIEGEHVEFGLLPSTEGDFFNYNTKNTAKVLIGYREKDGKREPVYHYFPNESNSILVDLAKYKIVHKGDEKSHIKYFDDFHKNFLIGENRIIESDSFLNVGVAVLKSNIPPYKKLFLLKFHKIPLLDGYTINGKKYAEIAYFKPLFTTTKDKNSEDVYIKSFGEIKDDVVLRLVTNTTYYPLNWAPKVDNTYDSKFGSKKILPEINDNAAHSFWKKSEFRDTLKQLLENYSSNVVGSFLAGCIFQFPKKTGEVGNPYNPFNNYVKDDLKPNVFSQYVYLGFDWNKSAKGFDVTTWKNNFLITESHVNYLTYPNGDRYMGNDMGTFISYREALIKFDEWFKYWRDPSKDGDFFIENNVEEIRLSSSDQRFIALNVFKIVNGLQYKFSLLFRRDPNETEINTVIAFRKIHYNWKFLYRLYFSITKNSTLEWLWFLIWLGSVLPEYPVGSEWADLPIYILGDSNTYNEPIHWFERQSNVSYTVQDWKNEIVYTKPSTSVSSYELIDLKTIAHEGDNLFYLDSDLVEWEEGDGLFDLVGTNFYVYKKGEQYEFIVKTGNESLRNAVSLNKKLVVRKPLNDVSQVINSSNNLYVFGYVFPLKWRGFLYSEFQFSSFSITPLPQKDVNSAYDVYNVIVKTDLDYIDKTIQVMKEYSTSIHNISLGDYENISYRIRTEQRLGALNIDQLSLQKQRFQAQMNAQLEDITYSERMQDWNKVIGSIGMIANVGTAGLNPTLWAATGSNIGSQTMSLINQNQDVRRQRRDYEINKRFGTEDFKIKEDQARLTFSMGEREAKRQIFNLENNVSFSSTNEASLHRALIDAKHLDDIFIMNLVPDGKLLEEINNVYKHYGYDIQLENYSFINQYISSGYVCKFSKVDAIEGVMDQNIKLGLKEMFESGIKVT